MIHMQRIHSDKTQVRAILDDGEILPKVGDKIAWQGWMWEITDVETSDLSQETNIQGTSIVISINAWSGKDRK